MESQAHYFGHCHVICEPELPGTLWAPQACNGTDLPFFTKFIIMFVKNIYIVQCCCHWLGGSGPNYL